MEQEVDTFLRKEAIEVVPPLDRESGSTVGTSSFRRRMGVTSDSRSAFVEPLSHATEVQNAHDQTGHVSNQVRGLVCDGRSERRILPHIHPSSTQEVPEVCFRGQSVPISGSSIRSGTLIWHFHQVCGCCSGSPATPGHPHNELHRRLVDTSSIRANGGFAIEMLFLLT